MNDVTIRKAELSDYDALCKLYRQVDTLHIQWYPEVFREPEGPARTKQEIGEFIMSKYSAILIAEREGDAIGLASFTIDAYPDYHLFKKIPYVLLDVIIVDKFFRGRGLGRKLYNEVVSFAKEKSINRLELKVYSKNEEAMRFYEKLGFYEYWKRLAVDLKKG